MTRPEARDPDLNVRLLNDQGARSWMMDERNATAWKQLDWQCGSDNPYLSEEFVRVWYECYEGPYTLVLIVGEDASGELKALMPLARRGPRLTGAGDYHAEYQGWLCTDADESRFLEASLREIARQFPNHVLSLRYVLSKTNQCAIDAVTDRNPNAQRRLHRRPLLELDCNKLEATLRKKGNRSKHNRLKRLGELSLQRIESIADFDLYMPKVVAAYDFRQGCVNGTSPFYEDECKLNFHRRWFESCPRQIELSIMLLNATPIAAYFGVRVGQTVANAIVSHDPAFAAYSASKLQIYLFAQELATTDVDSLDLTPGGDPWKDRFATKYDNVSEFVFYVSGKQALAAEVMRRLAKFSKRALAMVGLTPNHVRGAVARARNFSIGSLMNRIPTVVPDTVEYRIYRLRIDDRPAHNLEPAANVNSLTDLITYDEEVAQSSRAAFLAESSGRISRGEKVFTLRKENRLAHCAWVNVYQSASHFAEVDYVYEYQVPGAVLYDFYSHPGSQGHEFYKSTIAQMLNDLAAQEEHPEWAYLSVLSDNDALRHVVEKTGFHYVESVIRIRSWFRSSCRVDTNSA